MCRLRSTAVIILLQCVLAGLALPHKGNHHLRRVHQHRDSDHVPRDSQHEHKSHAIRHSRKHLTTTGALRENVPSPLQDFVLVSGSPLFHERPKASDSKSNATEVTVQSAKDVKVSPTNQTLSTLQGSGPIASQAEESNQLPKQEQKQPSNSTMTTSGPISEQVHENGITQHVSPASKTPFKQPKEFATAGLSKGKDQQKPINGSTTNAPSLLLTLQAPKNSSSDIQIGLTTHGKGNATATGVDLGKDNQGANASLAIDTVTINGNKGNGDESTDSSSEVKIDLKGNQTNTAIAADLKLEGQSQKPGSGNFPFNVPGIRNYGNERGENTGNNGTTSNKQLTDKENVKEDAKSGKSENTKNNGTIANKHLTDKENLGPNCHWKTTTGKNGDTITSVSCSGEFKKPDDHKGEMESVAKISLHGGSSESKQTPAENTSVPAGTAGADKEMHEQSDKEFEDEAIITTNAFRKVHRAFPMKLNPELSRQAKEYAEKIASMGSLQHDYDAVKQLDEGENLAMGCKQYGVPLTAKEAITNWYNEVCAYDFDRGEFSMSTGHFTQAVWSDSREFGIGKAAGQQNGMPCTFVVGRFKPSGNYKGEYKKNVFRGTFDPSYCDKLKDKKLL